MNINLQPDETNLGTWTLFYLPPSGGKYNGKLTVTSKRLLYDAMFDASLKGMVSEALFIKWGSEGYLEIDKHGNQGVEVQKKLLSKKCILTLGRASTRSIMAPSTLIRLWPPFKPVKAVI